VSNSVFQLSIYSQFTIEGVRMDKYAQPQTSHSQAWIAQTWVAFVVSILATGVGIYHTPVDNWIKGYLTMGLLFSIGSTVSLSKTIRDVHESQKILSRVDEVKLEKILVEHDPFRK
jgi:hypothetical protein